MKIVAIDVAVFQSRWVGADNVAVDEADKVDVSNAADDNFAGDENIDVVDDASGIVVSWHQYRVAMSTTYIISLGIQDDNYVVATF